MREICGELFQLISGAHVSVHEFVKLRLFEHLVNSTNAYVILRILFANFVSIKQVLNTAEFRKFWFHIFRKIVQRHI